MALLTRLPSAKRMRTGFADARWPCLFELTLSPPRSIAEPVGRLNSNQKVEPLPSSLSPHKECRPCAFLSPPPPPPSSERRGGLRNQKSRAVPPEALSHSRVRLR